MQFLNFLIMIKSLFLAIHKCIWTNI